MGVHEKNVETYHEYHSTRAEDGNPNLRHENGCHSSLAHRGWRSKRMGIRICRSRVAQLKANIPDGTFVYKNAVEMGHEKNVGDIPRVSLH
jgi:hypothetical protein